MDMSMEVGASAHAGHIVVDALEKENVKRVFCLPGSHILQLYDALRGAPSIRLVTCKQEPNASLMADAYGRITGEPGVCLLTAGPGGANSIAGVAQAYGAASPLIHITGSVPLDAAREAFHGADNPDFLVNMFRDVTKWSVRIQRIEDIPSVMARAFRVARSGRPGPVHVEIPRMSDYSPFLLQADRVPLAKYELEPVQVVSPSGEDVDQYAQRLLEAKSPVICAGKGVIRKNAVPELAEISEKFSIPVIYPQDSIGVIPFDHPFAVGHFFASRNSPLIGQIMEKCDLLLSVGLRAGTAEIEHMRDWIPPEHIFIGFDDSEDERYRGKDQLVADPKLFLRALLDRLKDEARPVNDGLRREIASKKEMLKNALRSKTESFRSAKPIHPGFLMQTLAGCLKPSSIVVSDVGNCQMFGRYYLPIRTPLSFMQSGVWNAMSFALPTAIVAKMEYPDRDVVGLVGDGAFLMTFGDFVTACELEANIVMVVLNDGSYGQIDRQQKNLYGESYGCGFKSPNFAEIARACDALGIRVEEPAELAGAFEKALASHSPAIVEVMTREHPLPSYE